MLGMCTKDAPNQDCSFSVSSIGNTQLLVSLSVCVWQAGGGDLYRRPVWFYRDCAHALGNTVYRTLFLITLPSYPICQATKPGLCFY